MIQLYVVARRVVATQLMKHVLLQLCILLTMACLVSPTHTWLTPILTEFGTG